MATGDIAGRLQKETVAAMKARDKNRLGVLRMLQAAIKNAEIDGRQELDEAGVLKVLSSYARKVKDQIASYRGAGRDDLLVAAEAELRVVEEFMPAELSEEELGALIDEVIAETGASGPRAVGKIMKTLMPKVAGRADGRRVSDMVRRKLEP